MKIFFIVLGILSLSINVQAQNYLWPIAGAKTGTDILYTPQSYIEKEHNFSNLFISAPKGNIVLCPADGEVVYVGLTYYYSNTRSSSWAIGDNRSFDEQIELVTSKAPSNINPKFLCGNVGIALGDGLVMDICGLKGGQRFKTGEKISAGDTLGLVSYSYNKINEPSIKLSISKNGKPSDPMSPFGLKTSFIPAKAAVKIDSLTKDQARKDMEVLFGATEELLPSLYKIVSPEEYTRLKANIFHTIDTLKTRKMSTDAFWNLVSRTYNYHIHDSHIYVQNYTWDKRMDHPKTQPGAAIGWEKDTLKLYLVNAKYKEHTGKEIVEVNGYSADSAKVMALKRSTSYDQKVHSVIDKDMAFNSFGAVFKKDSKTGISNFDLSLKFADGSSVYIPEVKGYLDESIQLMPYILTNRSSTGYSTKILNDSTAYLGISTFQLNEVIVEKIGAFVDSVSTAGLENFIVDVRNNPGGDINYLEKLFSYFATDTVKIESYSRVNKIGGYKYLDYTMNYTGMDTLFANFVYKTDGDEEGYYGNFLEKTLKPDSLINYRGRLYILTNEGSASAATLFPAMAVRSHRAVVVGRETQSAYHFLTAVKFAQLRLPNSTLVVSLPLVEEWFDTVVNARVPFGRGLIPDYEIPITHSELLSENGDVILNKTLELIEQGVYLNPENPFEVEKEDVEGPTTALELIGLALRSWWLWVAIGVMLALGVVLKFARKK